LFWFRTGLRIGLSFWFRLWLWARVRLRFRLRNGLRFRLLRWAIRLGHILQALGGTFHNEAHAYQSDSGADQAKAAAAGRFDLTTFCTGLSRIHTFFSTFRGIFRTECFLACARFRSGFRIHVWLRFRLSLGFWFWAWLFYLLRFLW